MWKQSENIVHRLFSRQISRAPPNTHVSSEIIQLFTTLPSLHFPSLYFQQRFPMSEQASVKFSEVRMTNVEFLSIVSVLEYR